MSIFKISAPVGAGKTYALAELCAKPKYRDRCVIYAAPTISLLQQTFDEMSKQGNNLSPVLIHSKQTSDSPHGNDPTVERLKQVVKSGEKGSKVLCTHQTLLSLMSDPHFEHAIYLSRFTLLMDEECSVLSDHYFKAEELASYQEPLETIDGELRVKSAYQSTMTSLVAGIVSDDSLLAPKYRKLIDRVVSPLYRVWGECHPSHISAVSVINPRALECFSEVVIIAALFDITPTALIWRHTFKIQIDNFPDITPDTLYHDPHKEGHRLKIHYLLPEGTEASITRLAKNNGRVAAEAGITVASHYGDKHFAFTCNNTIRTPDGKRISNPMKAGLASAANGKHMPTISHGMNSFEEYSRVCSLAITQPDNALVERVATLAGISPERARSHYRLATVYQNFGRCCIRVKGSTGPIEAIVLDKTAADQLAKQFKGAEVLGQLGTIQCEPSKQPTPRTRPVGMSKAEWRVANNWLTVNREKGLAGVLRPDKQEKFDRLYKHTQHFRDQQSIADAFNIEVADYLRENRAGVAA